MAARDLVGPAIALFVTSVTIPALAQGPSLSVADVSVLVGGEVTIAVSLSSDIGIRAFSFGLRHDSPGIQPIAGVPGATLLAMNGGNGPDLFAVDLTPANGPGATVGCIVSIAPPIEELPVGSDLELVVWTYLAGSATPGSTVAIDFASDLGSPPVAVATTVGTSTVLPATESGSITVTLPAVSGLQCSIGDACACLAELSWTNGALYDTIELLVDGLVVATIPGTATGHSLPIPAGGSTELCLRPGAGGVSADLACCLLECPLPPDPEPIEALVCMAGIATECTAELTWDAIAGAAEIQVLVDGVIELGLPATAIAATVSLGRSTVEHEICVRSVSHCGTLSDPACCMIRCAADFLRGNCNGTGTLDLSDAVFALAYLYAGGSAPLCPDACDIQDDGELTGSDPIALLAYLFQFAPPPAAPFPVCGADVESDSLACSDSPCP